MLSASVDSFTDPDTYHAAIRDAHAEGFVTGRGSFGAELTKIGLERLFLHRSAETLPRIAFSAIDPKLFLIAFPTSPGPPIFVNGLELSHGDIVVFRAGSTGYNRSTTACRWASIALAHEDIAAAGQAIIGRELAAPPVTHRIRPPPLLLSRLLNLHEAASHLAKTAPDILTKPEVARAMDQALVEAMVSCVGSGSPADERNAYRHHAEVMRRFEEVLRANSERPLYMAELCEATGVSYWTLRDCCQQHLSMSPKRYLLLRRMNLARYALRRANPKSTTVTEVAGNYGFWEFGRFSGVYLSLFGESPSTTLHRPPDDTPPEKVGGWPSQFPKIA